MEDFNTSDNKEIQRILSDRLAKGYSLLVKNGIGFIIVGESKEIQVSPSKAFVEQVKKEAKLEGIKIGKEYANLLDLESTQENPYCGDVWHEMTNEEEERLSSLRQLISELESYENN